MRDLFSIRRRWALRFNRLVGKPLIPIFDLNNQFEDFDLNKVDLLHFSNGISYGKTPWCTSFETIVPRFSRLVTRHQGEEAQTLPLDALTKRGLEALAGKACRHHRLVAKLAPDQEDFLASSPRLRPGHPKMTVPIHPRS